MDTTHPAGARTGAPVARGRSPFTVAIIGGGFTGSLLALKLASAKPGWSILLIESSEAAGRGLAYGACEPQHLLNVPVARMEVGLVPSFADWLTRRPGFLSEALAESKGVLTDAFVPRQAFGDYISQQLAGAIAAGRVRRIHGTAVGVDPSPRRVVMADSTVVAADMVVLATGNLPPRLPFAAKASDRIISDPWQASALDRIGNRDAVLLLGTGLTMVDTLLSLRARGHKGPVRAVSRHGHAPQPHHAGGNWPSFLGQALSPLQAFRTIRRAAGQARARDIPWQRVFDAARPVVASLWQGWSRSQRTQFLRHLRSLWDVHRHRMAERIAAVIDDMSQSGVLSISAGRILAVDEHRGALTVVIRPRGQKAVTVETDIVINCTGPMADPGKARHPLIQHLLAQGLVRPDPLGLGLETDDSAAIGKNGHRSSWLFALGPLTRPAFWEITAVPEINAQVDRLAGQIAKSGLERPLTAVFLDIGAGI